LARGGDCVLEASQLAHRPSRLGVIAVAVGTFWLILVSLDIDKADVRLSESTRACVALLIATTMFEGVPIEAVADQLTDAAHHPVLLAQSNLEFGSLLAQSPAHVSEQRLSGVRLRCFAAFS
jgi:hypothetical protein